MANKILLILIAVNILISCKTKQSKITAMDNKYENINGLIIPSLVNKNQKAPSLNSIEKKIDNKETGNKVADESNLKRRIIHLSEKNDSLTRRYKFVDKKLFLMEEFSESKEYYDNISNRKYFFKANALKYFYPDGKLKSYMVILDSYYTQGMEIGTWFYFDEDGNIVKMIDHESKFKTSFKDILQKIAIYKRNKFIIRRSFDDNNSYWLITLQNIEGEKNPLMLIVIDDKSGNIINEINMETEKWDSPIIQQYYYKNFEKETYKLFYD